MDIPPWPIKWPDNMSWGDRLKVLRGRRNLTQEFVALKLGKHVSHYSRLESGKGNLYVKDMVVLCNVFECSPNEFLGWPEERKGERA